jgi:L-threonylcarbamoyladenylate synthase
VPKILRPGAITEEMITKSTELSVIDHDAVSQNDAAVESHVIRVSGSLESHYSPLATVVLNQAPIPGQGFIAMSQIQTPEGVIRLAAPTTHEDFAKVLYSALRAADENGLGTVVVSQPVGDGIAIAIRDRLMRAAHPSTSD